MASSAEPVRGERTFYGSVFYRLLAQQIGRGANVDTQTKAPGPSSERGRRSEHRPETSYSGKGNKAGEAGQARKPSLSERLRQHWVVASAVAVAIIIGLATGLLYWLDARHYESTDDAFVAARNFSIAPKVGGYVTDVPVTDNQHVTAGQLLAQIDQRDYAISVNQAKAQLESATANIANIDAQITSQKAQIDQAKAQLDQAEAQLRFAQQEAARALDLVQKGAGTVQKEQQTSSDLNAQQANATRARSAVIAAELQDKVLAAQRDGAQAAQQQAQAQLDQADLNLAYTHVLAAQPGRIAKLTAARGAFVSPGQSLMMLVPDELWITANYKETQLADMRPGQPVQIRIDGYPDHELNGHVDSIQPGSGTTFSLLPAENATGNYVKVVQRVPVKIVVDNWPTDLSIGPGMSVVPWVKVR
jgi:membrane fusion protein, multidrug efflux system